MTTEVLSPARCSAAEAIFGAVFERSLEFRIQLNWDEALGFIRQIEEYNDFRAPAVIDALETVDGMIPRTDYGPDNPNTGRRSFDISVGREGSPVIYLERCEFRKATQLSEPTMRAICGVMLAIGEADEATYEVTELTGFNGRRIEFRFWWD